MEELKPKVGVWVAEVNLAVESAGTPKDGRIEQGRFIGCRHDHNAFSAADTIESIEDGLQAYAALGCPVLGNARSRSSNNTIAGRSLRA